MRPKANTKARDMSSTLSAESMLIPGESNWIQSLLRLKRAKDGRGKGVLSFEFWVLSQRLRRVLSSEFWVLSWTLGIECGMRNVE